MWSFGLLKLILLWPVNRILGTSTLYIACLLPQFCLLYNMQLCIKKRLFKKNGWEKNNFKGKCFNKCDKTEKKAYKLFGDPGIMYETTTKCRADVLSVICLCVLKRMCTLQMIAAWFFCWRVCVWRTKTNCTLLKKVLTKFTAGQCYLPPTAHFSTHIHTWPITSDRTWCGKYRLNKLSLNL